MWGILNSSVLSAKQVECFVAVFFLDDFHLLVVLDDCYFVDGFV